MRNTKQPLRFPRFNQPTVALLGKMSFKDRESMRRALQKLIEMENAGISLYDGAKILAPNSRG
jgi:hypothetical protein